MAQVITIAGERLFALKAQNNQQLDIDTFIFAFVPGQDSSAPIDRNEGLPPIGQRVHTKIVQQTGLINENAVVYSSVLDSLTGPFDFNWVGLYSSVNQTLIGIIHTPTVSKTVTVPGAAGNILNRNFVIEYSGIAELTGITVDAETWQLDYTARLNGMDELTRQLAADMNGKDWFIEDGFKVVPRSTLNTFKVTAGAGYVSGLRVELAADHILTLSSYPQFVYVDAWFDGTSESVWKAQTAFTVTNTEMDDYIDVNGRNHYVFKLARITAADAVEDLRNVNGLGQKIDIISESIKTDINIVPPSIPAIGKMNKVLFVPENATDCIALVISKISDGLYVANAITNEVSPSDGLNYGGSSPCRLGYSLKCSNIMLAKIIPHAKTSGVVISSLLPEQVDQVWNYKEDGPEYYSKREVGDFDFSNRKVYQINDNGQSITYRIKIGKECELAFGTSNASSQLVKIKISEDGLNFIDYKTINLSTGIPQTFGARKEKVTSIYNGPWFVKIVNESTVVGSLVYIAGVNIKTLHETDIFDFDCGMLQTVNNAGYPSRYQSGNGANEFAAKEASTGKFFGTYHGGHSDFLERLYIASSSIDIRGEIALASKIVIGKNCELYSSSKISVGESQYKYSSSSKFGDGCNITSYSVKLDVGDPVVCERVFTHMCTTHNSFNRVLLPIFLSKENDGDLNLGNMQVIQQANDITASSIKCSFSGVNVKDNSANGGFISFQSSYNKQYYGPVYQKNANFLGGDFVTSKEYIR